MTLVIVLSLVSGLLIGGLISYFVWDRALTHRVARKHSELEAQAGLSLKEREQQQRERFDEMNRKHQSMCSRREGEVKQKENELKEKEQEMQKRENTLKSQQGDLQRKMRDADQQRKQAEQQSEQLEMEQARYAQLSEELEKQKKEEQELLQSIAGLTIEEAKSQLLQSLEDEARRDAFQMTSEIIKEAKLNANLEAKKLVIQSIQRLATETAIDNSVSVFPLESDEIKGKIIGREGRNIRSLEAQTGVEIVVDDTPDAIVLSAFDPVRREVARLALHQLVQDGRIHPARIEEVVKKVRKNLEDEIMETGRRTIIDLGIQSMHPELVRMVGRLKYRSSYGQNLLQHSREVANLCAIMAAELGLNAKLAKRAGLLHDIGKVSETESDKPHALVGMELAQQYKEKPDVCNAIGAHHDEVEMTSLLSPIVQVCDSISGARPGARREVVEAYIKRLSDMEALAKSFPGVEQTYAIQAGRELRVVVGSEKVNDQDAALLASKIAQRIEDELTYPGQVKVTVIRETRAVMVAK